MCGVCVCVRVLQAPLVIEDDGDDFKATVNLRTAVGKKGKTERETEERVRGGGKRKRTRQRIMDSGEIVILDDLIKYDLINLKNDS